MGKAVTDSEPFSTTHVSNTSRPGLCNLLSIYNVLAEEPLSPLIESKREFKDVLVQVIDRHVSRFREAYAHMDDAYVVMQLRKGAEEAQKQANQKLHQVMRAVGLE